MSETKGNKPLYKAISKILGPMSKDKRNANWAIQIYQQTEVIHLFEEA